VLSEEICFTEESYWSGLLEHPQYTRPEEWHGRRVPEVLLSGHHANIKKWQKRQALIRTLLRRPSLLRRAQLDQKEAAALEQIMMDLRKPGDRK